MRNMSRWLPWLAHLAVAPSAGTHGQLVPILIKMERSGSTWLGKLLQSLTSRNFELELGNAGQQSITPFVQAAEEGTGFSLSVSHIDYSTEVLSNLTQAWQAHGAALAGRAAVIVLHRRNLVKHAVATLRWDVIGECNRAHGKAGCSWPRQLDNCKSELRACMSQPHALRPAALQPALQCLFRMETNLDAVAEAIASATGVPALSVEYEDLQVNFPQVLERIRAHLHIGGRMPSPQGVEQGLALAGQRLGMLSPDDGPIRRRTKSRAATSSAKETHDDLHHALSNFDSIRQWLDGHSSCLAQQLDQLVATHPVPRCACPWENKSLARLECGFRSDGARGRRWWRKRRQRPSSWADWTPSPRAIHEKERNAPRASTPGVAVFLSLLGSLLVLFLAVHLFLFIGRLVVRVLAS